MQGKQNFELSSNRFSSNKCLYSLSPLKCLKFQICERSIWKTLKNLFLGMNSMNTLMCISTFRFLVISNKVICIIKYSNLLEFKVNYFLYHMCSKYFYLHFPVLPVIQNWWHENCGCLDGGVLLDLEHPPGPSSASWLGNLCS